MKIRNQLLDLKNPVVDEVLCQAFLAPLERLLSNAGFDKDEASTIVENLIQNASDKNEPVGVCEPEIMVYDALEQKYVGAFENGILDSLPAVLEAIRNSISAAVLLGTCGGTVVFRRDNEFDRKEAADTRAWLREAESGNPADERA